MVFEHRKTSIYDWFLISKTTAASNLMRFYIVHISNCIHRLVTFICNKEM